MYLLNDVKKEIDNVGEIVKVKILTNGTKRASVVVEGKLGEHAEFSYYGSDSRANAENTVNAIYEALKSGETALKINYSESDD